MKVAHKILIPAALLQEYLEEEAAATAAAVSPGRDEDSALANHINVGSKNHKWIASFALSSGIHAVILTIANIEVEMPRAVFVADQFNCC